MKKKTRARVSLLVGLTLPLAALVPACASTPPAVSAEEVRDGEALPPAPPVPPAPPSSGSAPAPTASDEPAAVTASPAAAPAKEALTEAQIAKLSDLVNTAEVEQGKLAQGKAKAANVKKFAAMMVKHHGDALREQAKIAKKLNLTPADSATSASLQADGEKTLEMLKKTEAAGFDAAYVTSQIDAHQQVLELLDTQLLPASKTPEVTEALRRARAVVEQHLTQAQALQTN